MGVLSEVYYRKGIEGVIQVELSNKYEHKHQTVSHEDATNGLSKMAIDITMSLMRSLSNLKMEFSQMPLQRDKGT